MRHRPAAHERYGRRWNIAGVVAGLLLFMPLLRLGEQWLPEVRFRWHRVEYDRVASAVEAGQAVQTRLAYDVDPGPPRRVAFAWPGGIIDNWCGVVHDRTRFVLQVNEQPPWSDQWRAHPSTRLFGGDMFVCWPLDEPYYHCCFT